MDHRTLRTSLAATLVIVTAAAIVAAAAIANPLPHKHHISKKTVVSGHASLHKSVAAAKTPTSSQSAKVASQGDYLPYPWDNSAGMTGGTGGRLPAEPAAAHFGLVSSYKLAADGDTAAKAADWKTAKSDYLAALSIVSQNQTALRGLAQCAEEAGDMTDALNYYRAAIYTKYPNHGGADDGFGFQDNDPAHLMQFAVALSKAGKEAEALHVYNRAVVLFNRDPSHAVQLPDFGNGGENTGYTPNRLQGLAYAAIGREEDGHGDPDASKEYQEAVSLAPDSAVAHFYRGANMMAHNQAGAKAELQQAFASGDDKTAAEAKRLMRFAR
jgi:tetratricopeptide (TPR) repeat protein